MSVWDVIANSGSQKPPENKSILDRALDVFSGAMDAVFGSNIVAPQAQFSAATSMLPAAAVRGGAPRGALEARAAQIQQNQTIPGTDVRVPTKLLTPLRTAAEGADAAWSYGVARPLSTAALLANPEAPIYDDGFQGGDISAAWGRSEDVSFGRAVVGNPINKYIPGSNILPAIGGIDQYDPWSDTSMQAAGENPYYNFLTGLTDASLQFVVPPQVKAARIATMRATGLSTTVRNAGDIAILRDQWFSHRAATGGPVVVDEAGSVVGVTPKVTPLGSNIDYIAQETNIGEIQGHPLVANSTAIDKADMAQILARTTDRDTVAAIVMSNWGDQQALRALFDAAPDNVWALSSMRPIIQEAWMNGIPYRPLGKDLLVVNQMFDSFAARDAYFTDVKNLLVSEQGFPKLGSTWAPSRNSAVEAARVSIAQARRAMETGQTTAPAWFPLYTKQVLESEPTTVFLQWLGSKQMLGHVTKSGMRPNEYGVELTAMTNSVPMFRGNRMVPVGGDLVNGQMVSRMVPANELIASYQARLIPAARNGTLEQEWRLIENEMVDIMARELGVPGDKAKVIADGYRFAMSDSVNYLDKTEGFLFDELGDRIMVDPQTRRQMLNSFQTLPMEKIYQGLRTDDSMLLKSLEGGEEMLTRLFDYGMKLFRTNVLFRPAYIPKNSVAEPALAAGIAHGTILIDEGIGATLGNIAYNRWQNLKRVTYLLELDTLAARVAGKGDAQTRRALKAHAKNLVTERYNMQQTRDSLLAEWDQIKAGTYSPTYAANNSDPVRGALVEAQTRINAIEAQMDGDIPGWRQVVEPAALADVRASLRRYDDLLRDPSLDPAIRENIDALRAAYIEARDLSVAPLESPLAKIQELEQGIKLLDQQLGATQVKLGAKRRKLDDVTGVRGYKGSGQGTMDIQIGGEKFTVDAPYNEKPYNYAVAIRSETSAAETARLTLDPSYRAGQETARWKRTHATVELGPTDPLYWEEKAWAANAHIREDRLWQQILDGVPRDEIAKWLKTGPGKAYQKGMGRQYLGRPGSPTFPSPTPLDEAIRIANQYFPEPRVREILRERQITPGELQEIQGASPNLSRISGQDLIYNPDTSGLVARDLLDKALDKIWQGMTAHIEDRSFRWPFFVREVKQQMTQRAEILMGQGVKMTSREFDGLRQASERAALVELEKTFYNIRRYSTPVYQMRFLMSFPGAFFNSLYRYGRFVTREPERMFQGLLFASDLINHMGVDDEGNPTDLKNATYLAIPGFVPLVGGLKMSLDTMMNVTVNAPSASWPIPIAASYWVNSNPGNEENLRRWFGPAYDALFPFGVSRNPIANFFSGYQKNLWRAFAPSDVDFMRASTQLYANSLSEWEEAGRVGDPPTIQEATEDARAYYLTAAFIDWIDPTNAPFPVPGQMIRNAWSKYQEQYGANSDDARNAFMRDYGEYARYYTVSASDYSAYLPATQTAYDRIYNVFPDLAEKIVNRTGPDVDPSMVSLLALGTEGPFSQTVLNYYQANSLPGDDEPVYGRLSPGMWDRNMRVQEGWDRYFKLKAVADSTLTQLRFNRDNATTEQMKNVARAQIMGMTDWWDTKVTTMEAENADWAYDRTQGFADLPEQASQTLTLILDDPKFASTVGKTPLWQTISKFLKLRTAALEVLDSIPSTGFDTVNGKISQADARKGAKQGFVEAVSSGLVANTPEFGPVWERYFLKEWQESE